MLVPTALTLCICYGVPSLVLVFCTLYLLIRWHKVRSKHCAVGVRFSCKDPLLSLLKEGLHGARVCCAKVMQEHRLYAH